ncbi:hypothetical protein GLOTRDRAFT_134449 [Gloeophyllum trabeum ATCC 11539]|uniref:Uncharacterized protein n=1 Tax=Gloeophyllum trabeum (strain ATCC 11539 / FP-39264 / Madison 617) TaxID=670483 RepID=S7PRB4_GLOTA|nr:uncharacterized protein GLOTRDRAFT_134449 [Gloeophyllum trabeum ATCC 11539]EPQ49927.1 hypothetical protein GLOTRDRAFT_134449 [Gloeophyllum trabeum ATCC 11539]
MLWTLEDWSQHEKMLGAAREMSVIGRGRPPAGQNTKLLFVVDEEGVPLDGYRADEMRKYALSIFQSLREAGKAPQSWAKKGSSDVKQRYYDEMYRQFPELGLCEGNWKAEKLAIQTYFGFHKNHVRLKLAPQVTDPEPASASESDDSGKTGPGSSTGNTMTASSCRKRKAGLRNMQQAKKPKGRESLRMRDPLAGISFTPTEPLTTGTSQGLPGLPPTTGFPQLSAPDQIFPGPPPLQSLGESPLPPLPLVNNSTTRPVPAELRQGDDRTNDAPDPTAPQSQGTGANLEELFSHPPSDVSANLNHASAGASNAALPPSQGPHSTDATARQLENTSGNSNGGAMPTPTAASAASKGRAKGANTRDKPLEVSDAVTPMNLCKIEWLANNPGGTKAAFKSYWGPLSDATIAPIPAELILLCCLGLH